MADTLDEVVLKVKVKVDDEELKKLREEILKMQVRGEKTATKLGLESPISAGSTTNTNEKINSSFSDEIKSLNGLSNKKLQEILEALKNGNKLNQKVGEENEKKEREKPANVSAKAKSSLAFVNDLTHASAGNLIGGAVGGTIGALGGTPKQGASEGFAIGGIIGNIVSALTAAASAANEAYKGILTENLQLRNLGVQMGKTAEEVYKLGKQAQYAGLTLDEVANSNQSFANSLLGGFGDKQAQLFLSLGINPMDYLGKANGDFGKGKQLLVNSLDERLGKANPYVANFAFNQFGISNEERVGRRYLNRKEGITRAQQNANNATHNGETPFSTNEELYKNMITYFGAQNDVDAQLRRTLSTAGAAQAVAVKYMEVKAETINLIGNIVNGIAGDKNKTPPTDSFGKKNLYPQTQFNLDQMKHKSPASGSASAKATGS